MTIRKKQKRVRLNDPKPIGKNGGRRPDGTFAPGNKLAKGRPNVFAKKQTELRQALYEEATAEDVRAILRTLLNSARRGEAWAIKEVAKRMVGDSFIGPVPEPAHVELDGAELERRVAAAEAVQRVNQHGGKTISEELIRDFELLFEDGLTLDAVAGLAGIEPTVLEQWKACGDEILSRKRDEKDNADRLAVMLVQAERRGHARHRQRLLAAYNVAMLERVDPRNYARRDAEADGETYDPSERFI